MYGGLFGDLPPTKKEAKESKKPSDGSKAACAPVVATTKKAANSSTAFSIVRNVGVSGTAVAFVPTAARRRNAKRPTASNLKTVAASKHPAVPPTAAYVSSVLPTETNNYRSYTPLQEVIKTKEESLKEAPAVEKTVTESMFDESTLEESRNSSHEHNPNENHHRSQDEQRCRLEESLQKQVEEDPYDPFVPNDLLEYWEHQAAKRAWEGQQERRRKIEQELQQLEPIQQPSRGRGRGGVSNLPAWLVERQRQEAGLGIRPED
jgi:hypothetical protein